MDLKSLLRFERDFIFILEEDYKFDINSSGLSFFISVNGKKIIFDLGLSKETIKNIGLNDLLKVDYIVLSHGHKDHCEGLKYLNLINYDKILTHPLCFNKKSIEVSNKIIDIGSPLRLEEIDKSKLILSKTPYHITDSIIFLGEIPRINKVEKFNPLGYSEDNKPDYLLEDSAIVFKKSSGLIIVSGCAHSGILNIIDYARKVCNEQRIVMLIGGFHLLEDKSYIDTIIEQLANYSIKSIIPMHCINEYGLQKFNQLGYKKPNKFDIIEI